VVLLVVLVVLALLLLSEADLGRTEGRIQGAHPAIYIYGSLLCIP